MKMSYLINVMKKTNKNSKFAFTKNNYILLGIGVLFILIGFFLMTGGGSEDSTIHNQEEMFGFRRTVLSPIFIIGGFIFNVFAILYSPKDESQDSPPKEIKENRG